MRSAAERGPEGLSGRPRRGAVSRVNEDGRDRSESFGSARLSRRRLPTARIVIDKGALRTQCRQPFRIAPMRVALAGELSGQLAIEEREMTEFIAQEWQLS